MIDLSSPLKADTFTHVRIIVGIITGLCMTRLLNGLSRFVQQPNKNHVFFVHIGWTFFLLLDMVNFWWFQIRLANTVVWSFELYLFILFYASLYFFTCTILYPDKIDHINRMDDYFLSRRAWFFGLLIALNVTDLLDTTLKGKDYLAYLGLPYIMHISVFVVLCGIAMRTRQLRFHKGFAAFAIVEEASWALFAYSSIV
ncbi:MAG: hypothetical protein PHN76_05875 [Advenella sp.]|uniref:hypothetical protein n=1 Tax=Advenella sp. TaxID=1872388 RepID=UPI00258F8A3A|nr:hypothetical protein [Advenella sp.]MDD3757674.1 hypothetical protein [Advenella sp.]